MNVDSKAPPEAGCAICRCECGTTYRWPDNASCPECVEWNGEGTPPVGTVCEFKSTQNEGPHTYEPVEIMYVSKVTVVAKRLDENRGTEKELICHPGTAKFRPIRTPEQIAEEHLFRRISALSARHRLPMSESGAEQLARSLVKDGYRKFEIVEGE